MSLFRNKRKDYSIQPPTQLVPAGGFTVTDSSNINFTYFNSNLTADLTLSSVVAGTYGSSTQVPVLQIDQWGRVTGVTLQTISTSGLALETNGTPNGDQTLLNLVAGTNMTITDDGLGNITFDASGVSGVTAVTATAPLTSSGGTTPDISTSMNTNKLIGRGTAGVGVMEEITLGTNLSLSGTTLNATGGGGLKSGTATQVSAGVYTTTITGVTSYTAGDTYIIKFDSVNDGDSTLNISGVGAIPMRRNTDVKLNTGAIKANQEITVVYDGTNFQLIGLVSDQILAYVHNAEGAIISKGQAVYAYQATGGKMSVKLARADSDATSAKTIGLVYDSSIGIGGEGYIITQGVLEGVNTSMFSAGDTLYLSGVTFGAYVSTPVYAPTHFVYVGIVERANANGQIYVRCQNGYEMEEIHDVAITAPYPVPVNNDVLTYITGTPNLWQARSIGTILGGTTSQYVRGDGSLQTFPSVVAPATVFFGDGFDGAIILNGSNTYSSIMSLAGSTYTLLRSIYPSSITVNNGITLLTNGYQITCNGTMTVDGIVGSIGNAGGNAVTVFNNYSTAGAGGASLKPNTNVTDQILVGPSTGGGNGSNGVPGGWGSAGGSISVTWYYYGALGGGGGRGWVSLTTQGPASTVTVGATGKFLPHPTFNTGLSNHIGWLTVNVVNFGGVLVGSGGGGGGGAGTQLGGGWGGAGGGGGGGPFGVKILANALTVSATGIIRSNGGNGGNGCPGSLSNWAHGAGGGGGNGGIVYIVTNTLTYTPNNQIQAKGGIGGLGGVGVGAASGLVSTPGSNGADGYVHIMNTSTGLSTFYTGQY